VSTTDGLLDGFMSKESGVLPDNTLSVCILLFQTILSLYVLFYDVYYQTILFLYVFFYNVFVPEETEY